MTTVSVLFRCWVLKCDVITMCSSPIDPDLSRSIAKPTRTCIGGVSPTHLRSRLGNLTNLQLLYLLWTWRRLSIFEMTCVCVLVWWQLCWKDSCFLHTNRSSLLLVLWKKNEVAFHFSFQQPFIATSSNPSLTTRPHQNKASTVAEPFELDQALQSCFHAVFDSTEATSTGTAARSSSSSSSSANSNNNDDDERKSLIYTSALCHQGTIAARTCTHSSPTCTSTTCQT